MPKEVRILPLDYATDQLAELFGAVAA